MQWLTDVINPQLYTAVHSFFVTTHVAAAILSLAAGVGAMVTRKGGGSHRQIGRLYFWGMFVTNTTAFILLFYRFNLFLLGVTIISLYGVLAGYRVLYRKRPRAGHGAALFDWAAAAITLLAGLALIGNSILAFLGYQALGIPPSAYDPSVVVILPFVFGLMITSMATTDLRQFRQPVTDKRWWLYYHMNAMLGSYIGLTTALMVQQVAPRLPQEIAWLVWILPAVVGTVGISWWISNTRRRLEATRPAAAAAAD